MLFMLEVLLMQRRRFLLKGIEATDRNLLLLYEQLLHSFDKESKQVPIVYKVIASKIKQTDP